MMDTYTFPIPTHELLDRYELLYAGNENISDLRRAYIDNDLSSIFRLCNEDSEFRRAVIDDNLYAIFKIMEQFPVTGGHSDDLRRAVIEKNLYSLFRLYDETDDTVNLYRTAIVNKNLRSIFKIIGNDDLRKLIIEKNTWKLWDILDQYTSTQFTTAFKNLLVNNVVFDKDCVSRGQLQSKIWLINELKKINTNLGSVFLCAGWYGVLSVMLFESNIALTKIRSFDIDPTTPDIAKVFNKPWVVDNWKFQASVEDIHKINYSGHTYSVTRTNGSTCYLFDKPNTIINTSCEHITEFDSWYSMLPNGKLLVLQANDYNDLDIHTNCYNDLKDFTKHTPMKQVLYSGVLKLEKYNRFMRIGYK